ncbi:MAG: hypothetical protein ACOX5R_08210 [bacterium]|jgi:hypothetical protein
MIAKYPLYKKDFMILLKMTLAALALQIVLMYIIPELNKAGQEFWRPYILRQLTVFIPKLQIAINVLIALTASVYWLAEERAGQHILFLKRLSASRHRIWGEKLFAGVSIITLSILIQYLIYLVLRFRGVIIWDNSDPVLSYMIFLSFFAYGIGLLLSLYLQQSITIILFGIIITYAFLQLSILSILDDRWNSWSLVFSITGLVMAGFFPLLYPAFRRLSRIQVTSLLHKQINELKPYYTITLITFTYTLLITILFTICLSIFPDYQSHRYIFSNFTIYTYMILTLIAVLLSVHLGVITYLPQEKDTKTCILYYQPISRNRIFWTKFLSTFIPAALLAASIALFTTFVHIYYSAFASNFPLNDFWDIPIVFLNIFLLSLIPFFCALLCTHAISDIIYVWFETLLALVLVIATVILIFFDNFRHAILFLYVRGFSDVYDLLHFYPILLFIPLVLLLSSWRTATDQSVLTQSTRYKQGYVARLLFFSLALTFVLSKVGFLDLFYLITGFDIGIG